LEKKLPTIHIRSVIDSDFRFLFNLLKEGSTTENISHKKMPTYNEHKKFVKSKPYSRWYIVVLSNKKNRFSISIKKIRESVILQTLIQKI
jgi:hypothetical protein